LLKKESGKCGSSFGGVIVKGIKTSNLNNSTPQIFFENNKGIKTSNCNNLPPQIFWGTVRE